MDGSDVSLTVTELLSLWKTGGGVLGHLLTPNVPLVLEMRTPPLRAPLRVSGPGGTRI